MKRSLIVLLMLMMLAGSSYAGGWGHKLADSNDVVVLSTDSTLMDATGYQTDTTYHPDAQGISIGWHQYYLFIYGIADIDSSNYAVNGAIETDSGCYVTAMEGDSGNIGIQLQTSLDGQLWKVVYEDSTIRTRFTSDGDSTTRSFWLTATDFTDVDSAKCCPLVRASVVLHRTYHDAATYLWDGRDTVWLDEIRVIGIDY